MKKYLLISCLITASCAEPTQEPYQLPGNAANLLTGDSTKTWKLARRFNGETRMNMGDCFLSYRQTYQSDSTMHDNNGEQSDCGEALHATWHLVRNGSGHHYLKLISDQLSALMNIDEDHKYFKILQLSKDQTTVRFKHQQFSNKATLITDVYVPEDASVEDRDFHW